ncbi:MAG: hypothetical protein GXY83_29890 [Rhodopirellula sp.]|nr:hypothetical protein [Rhodopirellula sp.]
MTQESNHRASLPFRPAALLLVGPTSSGKTPLGELLNERGLHGTRCAHFDFGARLRKVVCNGPGGPFSRHDIAMLTEVLRVGALLENEHFPIAERVLLSFLAEPIVEEQTLIVLNGLPRHAGQAEAIHSMLDVRIVVQLECSVEIVLARLRSNVGGDRAGRLDDDPVSVRNKLELFHARTVPLIQWYQLRGARIETIEMTATTTPLQAWQALSSAGTNWICPT